MSTTARKPKPAPVSEADMLAELVAIPEQIDALRAETAAKAARRAQLVRDLIEVHGWSQGRIAAHLGISQPAVAQLLKKQAHGQ